MFLCLAVNAAGQEAARDFRFVYDTNPYLTLSNPSAVSFWDGRIATADVSFEKADGGLRDIGESPDSWEVVAGTESYFRISDLVAFHGLVKWSDFSGKDMGGPIMMFPGYDPVAFYESTEETVGTRQRELYTLGGEIALTPSRRFRVGAGINYQAGDQTKIKDPRFSNIWMDLNVNAGVSVIITDWLTMGTSVSWRNTLENVKGHIYGTTDRQYFIDTDKGIFFGTVAQLDGDYNYIPDSTPRPMNSDYLSGALQLVFWDKFTNEFSYTVRDGYYGKRSSTTATFFEFGGSKLSYSGQVLIPAGRSLHRIALTAGTEMLNNYENKFKYTTPEGGNTVVDYTGQELVLNKQMRFAGFDYRWYGGVTEGRASIMAGVSADWDSMKLTETVYPFWRTQTLTRLSAELFCQKNFFAGSNIFTLDAAGRYAFGQGTKKRDGTYVEGITSGALRSFDNYLDKHFEFETAPRTGASLALTYTRLIGQSFAPWIKVEDSFTTLLSAPEFLTGKTRNIITVSVGCTF
ncbi:MAG: hypothetical protein J6X89_07720 [Bacteroidales bacterium]|nr:hypothetical protein [Bacteroidales bacterium]